MSKSTFFTASKLLGRFSYWGPETQASYLNELVQPLVEENARLKERLERQAQTMGEYDKMRMEITKLRAALEELLKAWTAYFNPDVGPPGDENKQLLLFNQWTDTVAKTYEAIK